MKKNNQNTLVFKPTFFYSILQPIFWLIPVVFCFIALDYFPKYSNYISYIFFFFLSIYLYNIIYISIIRYELTEEELHYQYGVFTTSIDYLELYRIKDIKFYKSFLMRLIGAYSLTLYTSDKTHPVFIIKGINIKDLPKKIRQLVEINRKNKNVFEVD